MKIRMIGLKGLPAMHGGVERHVEELGARLIERGHEVVAYSRPWYTPSPGPIRGIKLKLAPTIHTKHLDATVHSFLTAIHAAKQDVDVVHFHGIGPAAFCFIPFLAGKKVVTTIHFRDYLRSKWGRFAQFALRAAEKMAIRFSHRVVTVSHHMERFFEPNINIIYIPNGTPDVVDIPRTVSFIETLGLRGNDYLLYVGRISPEKGPHHLLQAFREIDSDIKLVIAGGSNHNTAFETMVYEMASEDPRVIFTGYVDTLKITELYQNSRAFILASEQEGMPVALLEALAYGCPAVCTDLPAVREIATDENGNPLVTYSKDYSPAHLRSAINELLASEQESFLRAKAAARHVHKHFRWEVIAAATESVYVGAVTGLSPAENAMRCPLCERAKKKLEYEFTRSGRIMKCAECGMIYSTTPPPRQQMPPAFTDTPESYLANARDRLSILARIAGREDGKLLDVGCYNGHFSNAAKQLGYDVTSVEPDIQAANDAKNQYDLDIIIGEFENVSLPKADFDIVSFIQVFEHLLDPPAAMRRVREVLKPGGYLLVELPAYDAVSRKILGNRWRQFISDHSRFYTGEVFRRLLESEGFEIHYNAKVGKIMTPKLLADRIGRYYFRPLGNAIDFAASVCGVADKNLSLNLRDIRLVIAQYSKQ
jgi:glycosyltransferase involved in cell wall biosynthesis/SAM-dependent methyltransferase